MHTKDIQDQRVATRNEKIFVWLFIALNLTVPFVAHEFYPFTAIPLFPSAPQFYCEYEVSDFNGNSLNLRYFSLHRSDWGGRRDWPAGLHYSHGFNTFGVVPTEQELREHLESVMRQTPDFAGVKVAQHVYGKKGSSVGLLETRRFEIVNPNYRGRTS